MLRLRTLLTRSLAPAAFCALAVAACGGSQQPATTPAARASATTPVHHRAALYIYSGLPLSGPQRNESLQIQQGIRFALSRAGYQAGGHHIVYKPESDSAPLASHSHSGSRKHSKQAASSSTAWTQIATVRAASAAARNPATVAYIGDLDSGATELSLPILNQARIVQLTPGSGYPGLTDSVPYVTSKTPPPPEPGRYYPHGRGTLVRLIPNDLVQAAAAIDWLKKNGCHAVAATQFGNDPASVAMVNEIEQTAKLYKLPYYKIEQPSNDTKTYEQDAAELAAHGVNCFVLAGLPTSEAIDFTNELHAKLPVGSAIVGTSSMCNPHWTRGVPPTADPVLYCTTPVRPVSTYPGGKHFSALFQSADHRVPSAYTLWGYLAGTLVLNAIRGVDQSDTRAAVMGNVVDNVTNPDDYTFDTDGDLSLSDNAGSGYGFDKVVKGIPTHYKVLDPPYQLPAS